MAEETMTESTEQSVVVDSVVETNVVDHDPFASDEPNSSSMPDVDPVGNEADVRGVADVDVKPGSESTSAAKAPADAKPADAEQPVEQGLTEDQIARAKHFGFTDADVARFRNADELDLHVGFLIRADQQRQAAALAHQQQMQQAQATQAQGTQAAAQPAQPTGPRKFQLQLSDDLDDVVKQPLTEMAAYFENEVAPLQQRLQQVADAIMGPVRETVLQLQEQAAQVRLDRFDGFIGSLGDEWKDLFGSGPTDSLDPSSKELQARVRLFQAGEDLARGRQMANQRIADQERWKRGLGVEFGDQAAKRAAASATKKVAEQIGKQGKRVLSRPTGRRHELASKFPSLEAKAAELGVSFSEDEEDFS